MWTSNPYIWIQWLCIMGIAQALVQHPSFYKHFRRAAKTVITRAIVGIFIGQLTFIAASKSGAPSALSYVAQFVTVMRTGVVIDESGVIAKATEEAVIESFVEYAAQINIAASGTVANASADFLEVANLVTNSQRRVIYISSYLPRSGTGQGAVVNHNIASTLEQTRMIDGTNLLAWVWFSEEPAFAPGMVADIDVGGGYVRVACSTNYYPETESINGVDCVKYVFCIPEEASGVQFLPSYEVQFGTQLRPLTVPSGGITVETNNVTALPFTGTDTYFGGHLTVKHKGGIAVEAAIDSTPITNGVYQL